VQRNSKSKIIAGAVIIAAVALIAVAASMFTKDDAKQSSENSQDTKSLQQTTKTTGADESTTTNTTTNSDSTYKDGTYTDSETYRTEGGQEGLTVTLTVANNTVSSVSIQQDPSNHESEEYQSIFETSYKSKIVGKVLSNLQLSRISGASDTTSSFNDALDAIRAKAKA
jgi:uncharacterized protein with FMN-binding domain